MLWKKTVQFQSEVEVVVEVEGGGVGLSDR